MIPSKLVTNIRFGLATNSSSTHSIIHNTDINIDNSVYDSQYGWENFTLSSRETKKDYLLQQLKCSMSGIPQLEFINKELDLGIETFLEGYVDHDSVIQLPKGLYGDVNMGFFMEYYDYLLNNDFVILGGNDNSDGHPDAGKDDGGKTVYDFWGDDRAYKNGNYWVVIDDRRKMRVKFNDEPINAVTPELIDLKITDYCDIGCDFCYQNSTTDGIHGELSYISALANAIPYSNITEFAIGGGEPTAHPEFIAILRSIRNYHVINFTTKSLKWFKDVEMVEMVRKKVSGIAYSPDSVQQMSRFIEAHDKAFEADVQLYIHVIPELLSREELVAIVSKLEMLNGYGEGSRNLPKIKLTLLGFKPIGRSEGEDIELIPDLIEYVNTISRTQVGIDTKIAKDYARQLEGIDSKLFTTGEGEYSMYVDATKRLAYKSSYNLDIPIETVKNVRDSWDKKSLIYTMVDMQNVFTEIRGRTNETKGRGLV